MLSGLVTRNKRLYCAIKSTVLGKVSVDFSQLAKPLVYGKDPGAGAASQMAIAPAQVQNLN